MESRLPHGGLMSIIRVKNEPWLGQFVPHGLAVVLDQLE